MAVISKPDPLKPTYLQRVVKLNRSRKLEGLPGHYDSRPITSAIVEILEEINYVIKHPDSDN